MCTTATQYPVICAFCAPLCALSTLRTCSVVHFFTQRIFGMGHKSHNAHITHAKRENLIQAVLGRDVAVSGIARPFQTHSGSPKPTQRRVREPWQQPEAANGQPQLGLCAFCPTETRSTFLTPCLLLLLWTNTDPIHSLPPRTRCQRCRTTHASRRWPRRCFRALRSTMRR